MIAVKHIFICFLCLASFSAVSRQTRFYSVLGVPPNASQEEIRKKYKELAQQLHPDKHPPKGKESATKAFQILNQVYAVLGDPIKRAQYDRGEIDESKYFTDWNDPPEADSESAGGSDSRGNGPSSSRPNNAGRASSGGTSSGSNGKGQSHGGASSHSRSGGFNRHTSPGGGNSNKGNTLLHNAVQMPWNESDSIEQHEKRVLKMLRAVMESGDIDIQAQNANKATPLQLAVYHLYPRVFAHFLRNGADPNIPDKDGNYPLHNIVLTLDIAIKNQDWEFFVDHLRLKISNQNFDEIRTKPRFERWLFDYWISFLSLYEADFSLRNSQGKTPLELFMEKGLYSTALRTIQIAGADYLNDRERDRLIQQAINKGQPKIVRYLRGGPPKNIFDVLHSVFVRCRDLFLSDWNQPQKTGWKN